MLQNSASGVDGSKKKLRIVLVDDHVVVRQALAGLFRNEPDMEIAGEASDGESAVYLVREIRPDFVLMDVSMPGMNGIQATRIIHSELPEINIIGLSMFQTEELAAAMRAAGAVDYVSKSAPSENVVAAIRACA
jgi:DNA-binding NarL/FixJ family response regulator